MNSEARVMDFDNTITVHDRTVLSQLARDYVKNKPEGRRGLLLRGLAVSTFMKISKAYVDKSADNRFFTAETTQLNAFDFFFLRKARIPWSFVRERAVEYANYIPERHRQALKDCSADLYIISSEPTQLIEVVLEEAGVYGEIEQVWGNSFDIHDGVIEGLERISLLGGSKNKFFHIRDLPEKYELVRTIGDDKSDLGLFQYFRNKAGVNVEIYAIENAAPILKRFVGPRRILPSVVEFLEL